jgi:hypothetical protein
MLLGFWRETPLAPMVPLVCDFTWLPASPIVGEGEVKVVWFLEGLLFAGSVVVRLL